MSTSVVVVSCRPHAWLVPCLESVLDQADEVVAVDNGSPDGWATAQAQRLGARVVRLPRNVGFPAGVNAGLRAARGDVLALLNDDALAGPGWLAAADRALADPTIAAVCPKLLLAWPHLETQLVDTPWSAPGDSRQLGRMLREVTVAGIDVLADVLGPGVHPLEVGTEDGRAARWRWTTTAGPIYVPLPHGAGPQDVRVNGEVVAGSRVVDLVNNAGSYLSAEGHGGDYGYEAPDGEPFAAAADRFAACGAAMAMRADTLRRVGPFAPSFFAYYEDLDWSWRAQLAGLRVLYEPSAVVRHVRSVSTGGASRPEVRLLAARNRIHCLARNAPLGLVLWQVRRALEPGAPQAHRPTLLRRVSRGLAERRVLARRWVHTPWEVYSRWAGRDETWTG